MEARLVKSWQRRLERASEGLERVCRWLIITMLSLMSVLVFVQAFLRYVMGFSFFWVGEVTIYAMAWLTFVGASASIRKGEMIAFAFILDHLPRGLQHGARIAANVLVALFLLWVIVYGIQLSLLNYTQISPALQIPMTYPYLALPVGCCFILAQVLLLLGFQVLESRREEPTP